MFRNLKSSQYNWKILYKRGLLSVFIRLYKFIGMSRSNSLVDLKQFETNFHHVLYVLVYAFLNHSLLGEYFTRLRLAVLCPLLVIFLGMVIKFSYSKPPGRKMVGGFKAKI